MSTARVITHTSNGNHELITMVLKMPKCLIAEFNTHRSFSRNSASSRAIPHAKFRRRVEEDPFIPRFMRHPEEGGMAANEPLDERKAISARRIWRALLQDACASHRALSELGVSKGQANRVLEPFFLTEVIATNTRVGWESFFALRAHWAAQTEIQTIAYDAIAALEQSVAEESPFHFPFCTNDKDITVCIIQSVVNCARVSYLNHEGKTDPLEKYIQRFNDLIKADPIHGSPFEHIAAAVSNEDIAKPYAGNFNTHGPQNFVQLRKVLELEGIEALHEFFPGFNHSLLSITKNEK